MLACNTSTRTCDDKAAAGPQLVHNVLQRVVDPRLHQIQHERIGKRDLCQGWHEQVHFRWKQPLVLVTQARQWQRTWSGKPPAAVTSCSQKWTCEKAASLPNARRKLRALHGTTANTHRSLASARKQPTERDTRLRDAHHSVNRSVAMSRLCTWPVGPTACTRWDVKPPEPQPASITTSPLRSPSIIIIAALSFAVWRGTVSAWRSSKTRQGLQQ